ncbi:Uncharacterised protein [Mycobacteroides abscessus subsp. massiliense]|nr:Uncharacterised protein [Mycobacteroides abscessus subsp. massiliense]
MAADDTSRAPVPRRLTSHRPAEPVCVPEQQLSQYRLPIGVESCLDSGQSQCADGVLVGIEDCCRHAPGTFHHLAGIDGPAGLAGQSDAFPHGIDTKAVAPFRL